ncbi:MAG: hypothetical protein HFE74_07880 [Firmicutes bacterium]|jgi:alpha-ribazole phosphatase|nr:hypothetical protein [Bacillota bacterium]
MKISCIHFIRHGITEGIVNKWYYGNADLPLIEDGINELTALKEQGIYPNTDKAIFYTSGMIRANQTLESIFGRKEYTVIENLKEMNFGLWECKTFDELKLLDGFDEWMSDKEGIFAFPGGGDSTSSFYARVAEGLEELIAYHNSPKGSNENTTSVVVCHGGVIAACMCNLFNKPKETFWEWIPKPGRGYTVYFEDHKPVRYDVI